MTPDPYKEYVEQEMIRELRTDAVRRILADMRYQTRSGISTMGPCRRGCGKLAHGAGVCRECLRDELAAEAGRDLAEAYATAYYAARRIEAEIWAEVGL